MNLLGPFQKNATLWTAVVGLQIKMKSPTTKVEVTIFVAWLWATIAHLRRASIILRTSLCRSASNALSTVTFARLFAVRLSVVFDVCDHIKSPMSCIRGLHGHIPVITSNEVRIAPSVFVAKRFVGALLRIAGITSTTKTQSRGATFNSIKIQCNADKISLFEPSIVLLAYGEYAIVGLCWILCVSNIFLKKLVYKVWTLVGHPALRSCKRPLPAWQNPCRM